MKSKQVKVLIEELAKEYEYELFQKHGELFYIDLQQKDVDVVKTSYEELRLSFLEDRKGHLHYATSKNSKKMFKKDIQLLSVGLE